MLLRYIALHGSPETEEDWEQFHEWKQRQLALAECQMTDPEGVPDKKCDNCPGAPDCPKARRKA